MSVQTNFRAQDMPGAKKPEVKKATPKYVAPTPKPKPEPVIEVAPAKVEDVVEEEVVAEDAPASEDN
jgi:hypothetical protein